MLDCRYRKPVGQIMSSPPPRSRFAGEWLLQSAGLGGGESGLTALPGRALSASCPQEYAKDYRSCQGKRISAQPEEGPIRFFVHRYYSRISAVQHMSGGRHGVRRPARVHEVPNRLSGGVPRERADLVSDHRVRYVRPGCHTSKSCLLSLR
jgi:hypothetical protein